MSINKNKFRAGSLLLTLMTSFLVALAWMIIARDNYSYGFGFTSVAGINLYPLFAWTIGLFLLYIIHSYYIGKLKKQTFAKKLGLFVLLYWPLLIAFEAIAYHIFNIKNLATAAYPGLPLCGCLHAPLWMQIGYFTVGIVFFLLCYFLMNIVFPKHLKSN